MPAAVGNCRRPVEGHRDQAAAPGCHRVELVGPELPHLVEEVRGKGDRAVRERHVSDIDAEFRCEIIAFRLLRGGTHVDQGRHDEPLTRTVRDDGLDGAERGLAGGDLVVDQDQHLVRRHGVEKCGIAGLQQMRRRM